MRCGSRAQRRAAHHLRERRELADQRRSPPGCVQPRARAPRAGVRPALGRVAQHRGDARVRVLHVVRRVLVVLPLAPGRGRSRGARWSSASGRRTSRSPRPTSSIRSRSVTNSPARLLIFTGWPPDSRFTCWTISTSRKSGSSPSAAQRRLQRHDVAVVVGPPQVDRVPEAARVLVAVVGDVGQQVGRHAVARAPPRGPCRRRTGRAQ